jgi:FtsH-binding integral membrane protein
MIGYIMFDFSVIKKSQAFMDVVDSNTQRKFVFMFGFMLLVDLIQLLWVVIRIFILSRS